MMRVIDGAKVFDGANNTPDIPVAARAASTIVESSPVDMADPGHDELIVSAQFGERTGLSQVVLAVQESNEAGANFANVPGSSFTTAASNIARIISIDWTHPDRKRYARIRGQSIVNTHIYGAATLRMRPRQKIIADDNVILV